MLDLVLDDLNELHEFVDRVGDRVQFLTDIVFRSGKASEFLNTAVHSAEEDAIQPLVNTAKADTLSSTRRYRDCTMRRRGTHSFLTLLAACILTASLLWDGARAQGTSPVKVPQSQDECDDLFLDFDMAIGKTLSAGAQTKILRDQGYNKLIPQLCKDGKYQEVYDLLIGYLRPPPQNGCVPGSFLCDR